jgi:hypothetical protein
MGCDIHLFVERKVGDVWKRVSSKRGYKGPHDLEPSWRPCRNYTLFGILAGVRSTILNADIPPRGLPEDVSKAVKKEFKNYHHTPSYLTLPELIEMREKFADIPCYLDVTKFKKYKKTGVVPQDYYSSIPRNIRPVSNEQMARVMNMAAFLDENEYFTKIDYKESYKDIAPDFFVHIVSEMEKLSKDINKVRCVFWFDS